MSSLDCQLSYFLQVTLENIFTGKVLLNLLHCSISKLSWTGVSKFITELYSLCKTLSRCRSIPQHTDYWDPIFAWLINKKRVTKSQTSCCLFFTMNSECTYSTVSFVLQGGHSYLPNNVEYFADLTLRVAKFVWSFTFYTSPFLIAYMFKNREYFIFLNFVLLFEMLQ